LFLLNIFSITNGQGILDSLSPQGVLSEIEEESAMPIRSLINPYPYEKYLLDSSKIQTINDSYTVLWTQYDSLPKFKSHYQAFYRLNNRELDKNNTKPAVITYLYLLLLLLLVVKYSVYNTKARFELRAIFRKIIYRDWLADQLTILNPYNIVSKAVTILGIGILISVINLKLNLNWANGVFLESILIVLLLFGAVFLKYFIGFILANLFDNEGLLSHHFSHNQLIGSLLSVPIIMIVSILYFMNGIWDTSYLYIIILVIVCINLIYILISFSFSSLNDRSNKFLYVFFYLCTLEIIPALILVRWIAVFIYE
jgi:hypothetical protein